jgi:hypothetical protein
MTVTDFHIGIHLIIFRVTRTSDKLYSMSTIAWPPHHHNSHHGGLSPLLLPNVRRRPGRLCYAANCSFQTKEQRIRTSSGGRYGWQF